MNCQFAHDTNACEFCGFVCLDPTAKRNCPAHPHYGRLAQLAELNRSHEFHKPPSGPGTELRALIGRFGVTGSGDCKCLSRADLMDAWGCDECSRPERIDEIVGWLRESAAERGLPFLDVAAMLLVRRAIHNARRKEQARAQASAQAEGGAAAG